MVRWASSAAAKKEFMVELALKYRPIRTLYKTKRVTVHGKLVADEFNDSHC